jgi:hypothetical protein
MFSNWLLLQPYIYVNSHECFQPRYCKRVPLLPTPCSTVPIIFTCIAICFINYGSQNCLRQNSENNCIKVGNWCIISVGPLAPMNGIGRGLYSNTQVSQVSFLKSHLTPSCTIGIGTPLSSTSTTFSSLHLSVPRAPHCYPH